MEKKKKFNNKKSYNEALEIVYDFHKMCFETILAYLQENGDIDVREEEWSFEFLEYEGVFDVEEIKLNENKTDFYLSCRDCEGNYFCADWITINHDMIITELLMGLVLDK